MGEGKKVVIPGGSGFLGRILRTETELVIKSRRVVPGRLLAAGFQFQSPDIESAFADILRK
jgi:NAD dependent epimerase/dehydratase family enzyme